MERTKAPLEVEYPVCVTNANTFNNQKKMNQINFQ